MKVKNRNEAWRKANELFPFDYMVDTVATERAGYDIYRSTYEDSNSWISDLGDSLEVNIEQKDGTIWSGRIWIENEPEITETSAWHMEDVRDICVKNDWYTAGNIKEYSKMLKYVEDNEPTVNNIYRVAKDIYEHSEDKEQTIESIMFLLKRDVVMTFYNIKERG